MSLNESHVEESALSWFQELGYTIGHGSHLAPGERQAERGWDDESCGCKVIFA